MWLLKHFNELSVAELYAILQLRSRVFVVEQNCVYQDADNKDQEAWHFFKLVNNSVIAYCRLLAPGKSFAEASIGRVATDPGLRREGHGREMMVLAIEHTARLFQINSIRIGAQLYLKEFYQSFGFQQDSEIYLEDNIPHIEMLFFATEPLVK